MSELIVDHVEGFYVGRCMPVISLKEDGCVDSCLHEDKYVHLRAFYPGLDLYALGLERAEG